MVPPSHHVHEVEIEEEDGITTVPLSTREMQNATEMTTESEETEEEEEREGGASLEDVIMDTAKQITESTQFRHAIIGLSLSLAVTISVTVACCCLVCRRRCNRQRGMNPSDIELRQVRERSVDALAVRNTYTLPPPRQTSPERRSRAIPPPSPSLSLPLPPPPTDLADYDSFYEIPITPPKSPAFKLPPTPSSSSSEDLFVVCGSRKKKKTK